MIAVCSSQFNSLADWTRREGVTTTKSSRRVLQVGFIIYRLKQQTDSNRHNRMTFSQPQLLAYLLLKEFLQF